jgi:hypothetical protein
LTSHANQGASPKEGVGAKKKKDLRSGGQEGSGLKAGGTLEENAAATTIQTEWRAHKKRSVGDAGPDSETKLAPKPQGKPKPKKKKKKAGGKRASSDMIMRLAAGKSCLTRTCTITLHPHFNTHPSS